MHAATKAGTVGLGLLLLAVAFAIPDITSDWYHVVYLSNCTGGGAFTWQGDEAKWVQDVAKKRVARRLPFESDVKAVRQMVLQSLLVLMRLENT